MQNNAYKITNRDLIYDVFNSVPLLLLPFYEIDIYLFIFFLFFSKFHLKNIRHIQCIRCSILPAMYLNWYQAHKKYELTTVIITYPSGYPLLIYSTPLNMHRFISLCY